MTAALCRAGIVRVARLVELGVDRRTISRRCRPGGPWSRLGPGVVKLSNGPHTREDRRIATLLQAGPGAMLTGLDALELHGVRTAPTPHGPVHVLIPHDRRRSTGALMLPERSRRVPEPVRGRRHSVAPVARAVVDAARRSRDPDLVRTLFADVVQHGHCAVAELVAELGECSSRGTAMPRTVLAEIVAGVRSVAEADARRLLRRSRLPEPEMNVRLAGCDGRLVAVVDLWWDDVGMAWEIDSVEFHLSPDDYARTVRRRSELSRRGVVVVQSLPGDLRRRPDEVLDELDRSYTRAGLLPAPEVTRELAPV
ncbi:hypothetical protein SAMN05216207_1004208 [Pseudonocardia ammonioxydans]|uniref:Transcriptional regulator, AbiEi antitoxin, Type IV TA system n=1 Tax=Pseudonocardia ammonioxydans TaxID=260086 RepID=A0A1I4UPA1_PSUAM|nr:hypothetical protein [Pseudonocardia ammonioxydans]SFM90796.1 hypothetical protein SAMN05216207_1004208 [Pseudonocardia ammonioxydans]